MLLFPNKEAAQEHIEGNQLRSWLLKAAEVTKVNKYTVEQLRAVKENSGAKYIDRRISSI